ncbi:MAG: hypothetical protein AB8D52_09670 [Gammaproteobacteria bacterium]
MKTSLNKVAAFFIINLMIIFSVNAEQMSLEIIPLKHRLVNDVVPILQPLVVEGGSVSGMNDQLIIRTTDQNMRDLIRTLEVIDQPLRSLKISVRYDTQSTHQNREHGVDGYYNSGNVRIETRNRRSNSRNRVVVSARDKNGGVRYRSNSTRSQFDDDDVYFVRTVEGQSAWIQTGKSIPEHERTVVLRPYGSDVYDSVNYRDITSGFYVVPNLSGDNVTLFISPERSRVNNSSGYGRVETQQAETTITGKLGQWIELGGVTEEYRNKNTYGTYQTKRYGSEQNHIFVRVEQIR